MPTIYRDWLYAVLRHLLTAGGGWLIHNGYASSDVLTPQLLSGMAMLLGGVLLSAYQKYTAKQVQLTAQVTQHLATEDSIKAKVEWGGAPSVFTPPDTVPVTK